MIARLSVIVALVSTAVPASAKLVFLGYQAVGKDAFTVGLLEPLSSGEVLRFSDHEWNGSAFDPSGAGDSYLAFTPSTDLPVGTILTFGLVDFSSSVIEVTDGFGQPVAGTLSDDGSISYLPLTTAAEGLYAYLGPTFTSVSSPLASLRTGVGGGELFGASTDFTASASLNGADTLVYDGPTTIDGPYDDFVALVSDPTNWRKNLGDSETGLSIYDPPTGVLSAVAAVPEPSAPLIGGLVALVASLRCVWGRRRSLA